MPKHLSTILIALIFSFFGVLAANKLTLSANKSEKEETTFDRVMRTNTLRCGYYVFPPFVMRDPNTNEMSGFVIDMMKVVAEKTGLKIEWTEESTFGNWIPALQTKRYDAMCAPMWPDMALGREVIFTRPLLYAAMIPVVRANDTRFDGEGGFEKMNDPSVTMLAQDGNLLLYLTKEVMPKANLSVMPATMDMGIAVQNITMGKIDGTLWDKNGFLEFSKHNPGSLKILTNAGPIKSQPFSLPLNRNDTELREFLDNAVLDLLVSGTIDRLLTKWEPEPDAFLRVSKPYR